MQPKGTQFIVLPFAGSPIQLILPGFAGADELDTASRRAIKATFDRRKTRIPVFPPLALMPEFAEDKQKSIQWNAFLRKSNLDGKDLKLSEITSRLADFLMPPSENASRGVAFDQTWNPTGGWEMKS